MLSTKLTPDLRDLGTILKAGGSLMGIKITPDDGSFRKIPSIKGWEAPGNLPIETPGQLESAAKVFPAFGYHPEDVGAFVVDLDRKDDGRSGEDTLRGLLGDREWFTNPQVFVETPNGLHLYFDRATVPEDLLNTNNGLLPCIDTRGGDRNGYLMAPGSLGWCREDQEWKYYTLEGDLFDLPPFPEELTQAFRDAKKKKSPPKKEGVRNSGDGGDLDILMREFDRVKNPDLFTRLIDKHVPAARWSSVMKEYRTADLSGLSEGNSCGWNPGKFLVKDFGDTSSNGMGFDIWLSRYRGFSPLGALREILSVAGVDDPTAVKISRSSVNDLGRAVGEAVKAAQEMDDEIISLSPFNYSDLGNAERFAHLYGDKVKYIQENKDDGWVWYEGGIWRRKSGNKIQSAAKSAVRSIKMDKAENDTAKSYRGKWAKTSESAGHLQAMLNLAKKEESIFSSEDDFDKCPDLLPCFNGVVDLKTGNLLDHSPDYRFTRQSPVIFDPQAQAPRWEAFLDQITLGRRDLRDWLQYFFGYCLTGQTTEQIFPVFYGTGGNGKSVLINLINKVMGGFFGTLPANTLTAKNMTDDKRSELAMAKGTRLQVMSESKEGGLLDTVLVKSATGGDPITCRHLYGSYFTYVPSYKIVLLTNHRPQITSHDDGIWRRVKNIPFDFSAEKAGVTDKNIEEKLTEELPGILLWAIRGAVLWYDNGRKIPKSQTVEEATQDYRDEQDLFGQWVEEYCKVGEDLSEPSKNLLVSYNEFLEESGVNHTSAKKMSGNLKSIGCHPRIIGNARCWIGITLNWK